MRKKFKVKEYIKLSKYQKLRYLYECGKITNDELKQKSLALIENNK